MITKYNLDNKITGKPSDFLAPIKVARVNSFTEKSLDDFQSDINTMFKNKQDYYPIIIDSFGGQVYSLLGMIDIIKSLDKPVVTIASGKAMSCGSILLSCGTPKHRYVTPNSTVMIHDASGFAFGKVEEIKATAQEVERLQELIFDLLNKNCNQSNGFFQKEIHDRSHAEWYLTPSDTVKYGLADKIGMPTIEVTASVSVSIS